MTTAEGVETQQQLQQVKFLGCTGMQGSLFSPPRRVEEIARLLWPRVAKKTLMA
jgi:EAL domain-containing protein (putative c-di-GMP-specific phosphodiesterase class I)